MTQGIPSFYELAKIFTENEKAVAFIKENRVLFYNRHPLLKKIMQFPGDFSAIALFNTIKNNEDAVNFLLLKGILNYYYG